MGLIQDFIKEPETFLGKYAVIVGDETEWDGRKPVNRALDSKKVQMS
jgi:hypothetical protein